MVIHLVKGPTHGVGYLKFLALKHLIIFNPFHQPVLHFIQKAFFYNIYHKYIFYNIIFKIILIFFF